MPSQFDAFARVSLDLRSFKAGSDQIARSGGVMEKTFAQLHQVLEKVEVVEKKRAAEISRSLSLYTRIASAAKSYASAVQALATNSQKSAQGVQLMERAFSQLRSAMASVTGLSAKEESRLARTLGLYEKMARAMMVYAQAQNAMLSAGKESNRAAEASRRLAIEEKKVALAQQRSAASARAVAAAQAAAARNAQQLASSYRQAAQGMHSFGQGALAARADLSEMATLFQTVMRVAQAFGRATVGSAISHEAAFAQVARVTGAVGDELAELSRGFESLAAQLPVSFEEFARIGQLASQTGVANDALLRFSSTVARFAVTTGIGTEEITLLFGRIQQMQDIPVHEMENFASTILALGTASASTESEILKVGESIATVTNLFGLTSQATAALSSSLATLRVRPELARGALTRVFNELSGAIKGGGQRLEVLANLMNTTGTEVQRLYETDPDKFFLRFVRGLSTTTGSANGLQDTLRSLNINAVRDIDTFSRLGNNYELLAEQMDMANMEWQNSVTLQRQSQTILDTTAQKVDNFKDALGTLGANLGKGAAAGLGVLAAGATTLVESLNDIPKVVQTVGTIAVGLAGAVVVLAAFRVATAAAQRTALSLASAGRLLRGGFTSLRHTISGVSNALIGNAAGTERAAQAARLHAMALERQAGAAGAVRAATLGGAAASGAGVGTQAAAQQRLSLALAASATAQRNLNQAMALGTAQQARSAAMTNAAAAASLSQARSASAMAGSQKAMAQSAAVANSALGLQAVSSNSASSAYQALAARQREVNAMNNRVNQSMKGTAAAVANSATSARNLGLSMTGLANVQRVYGASLVGTHQAQGQLARASAATTTAVTAQTAALSVGTRVAQAFGVMGRFVAANWAPLLVLGLALTPLIAAWASNASKATDNAKKWADASRDAVGGTAELERAIKADTAAFQENGKAVGTYTVKASELTGAARLNYDATKKTADSLRGQAEATYGSVAAMEKVAAGHGNAAATAMDLKKALDAANESLKKQGNAGTIAFGEEFTKKTVEGMRKNLDEAGVTSSNAAMKRFLATGVDLAKTFDLLGTKGKGPAAAIKSLAPALGKANEELRKQEDLLKEAEKRYGLSLDGGAVVTRPAREARDRVKEDVENAKKTRDALQSQIDVIQKNRSEFDKLARAQKILSGSAKDAASGLDAVGVSAEEDQAALEAFDDTVSKIVETLQGVGGPATAWAAAMEKASAANSDLSKSQVAAAVTSKQLLQAMRDGAKAQVDYAQNLVQVMAKVPQDVALYLSQLGPEGAQQVALLNKMTKQELNEYVKLWQQTSPEASAMLASGLTRAIPQLAAKGGELGKAIGDGIARKLKMGDISGAVADLEKSMELVELMEVHPKVKLDDAPAKLTMEQLIAWVKVRAFELDVKGKADLTSDQYKTKLQELLASLVGKKAAKQFDINGLAKLSDEDFRLKMGEILGKLLSAKDQKLFDIDGLAKLTDDEFVQKLGEILGRVGGVNKNGELNIVGVADVKTDEFHRKLGGIVQAAYASGSQIQQALTRTATVSVAYRAVNSPPAPPRTAPAIMASPSARLAASVGSMAGNLGRRIRKVEQYATTLAHVARDRQAPALTQYATSTPQGVRGQRSVTAFERTPRRMVGPMGKDTTRRTDPRAEVNRGPMITVHNTYPRAEPTSTTINRSLAYVAAMNGTI